MGAAARSKGTSSQSEAKLRSPLAAAAARMNCKLSLAAWLSGFGAQVALKRLLDPKVNKIADPAALGFCDPLDFRLLCFGDPEANGS